MSSTAAGVIFVVVLAVALAVVYRPFGDYMYWTVTSKRHLRVERVVYRLVGVKPDAEQSWGVYARSVLAFAAVSVLFLYLFQRVQSHLWLSLGLPNVKPALAWNTASSFTTNTNWQNYSGESTMGYLVQMSGLAVQNFVSAAMGVAVAVALVRGFARKKTDQLGNFWVDLIRISIRVLLPICRARLDRVHRRRHGAKPARLPGDHRRGRARADDYRRPGRLAGGHQGPRHQRRRLLQRQLGAPVREPDHLHELDRDLPAADDLVQSAPDVRPDGRQHQAGPAPSSR